MQPSFLVIGTAKCGTTTLCELLRAHPEVFVTEPKEPHYFSRLATFQSSHAWYESLFEGAEHAKAAGEGSVSYTLPRRIDFVAPRIRKEIPDCRLVLMVRHPIDRLESDWIMRKMEGREIGPINEAVDMTNLDLVTLGQYWKSLNVYRDHFDDEQILVVFLEDFSADSEAELERVYGHIGVNPDFRPEDEDRQHNTRRDRRQSLVIQELLGVLPGLQKIRRLVPDRAGEFVIQLLSRRQRYRPEIEWDEAVLDGVRDFLREDSRRLLEYCGKPADFWERKERSTRE